MILAQVFAGQFGHAFASNYHCGMLRPGDVINKVIINSGIIFAEIIHAHDDGRKYPASHIVWDKCVRRARELFLKNGKILFCTQCESPLCAVNEAMVKERL